MIWHLTFTQLEYELNCVSSVELDALTTGPVLNRPCQHLSKLAPVTTLASLPSSYRVSSVKLADALTTGPRLNTWAITRPLTHIKQCKDKHLRIGPYPCVNIFHNYAAVRLMCWSQRMSAASNRCPDGNNHGRLNINEWDEYEIFIVTVLAITHIYRQRLQYNR